MEEIFLGIDKDGTGRLYLGKPKWHASGGYWYSADSINEDLADIAIECLLKSKHWCAGDLYKLFIKATKVAKIKTCLRDD